MTTVDDAIAALRIIQKEFADFCQERGKASEADTRVKVIDRILKEVCLWPESKITREERVDYGVVDYIVTVRGRRLIAVEAKREGVPFVIPAGQSRRTLSLSGALLTDREIEKAVQQVRGYCSDEGIRYAIATNGYSWVIFRAVRDDMPWRNGRARVFKSLEQIEERFTEFWNLLSYEAIVTGALDAEFGSMPVVSRNMHRVVSKLPNADAVLLRNRLNNQLQPIIKSIFEDISRQEDRSLFQSCYVYNAPLRVVADDLNVVITDAIPKFVEDEGGREISQSESAAGVFQSHLGESMASGAGEIYLLLGGIGSGKSTFLRRYQRLLQSRTLDERAYWFHVDFLGPPLEVGQMEQFVWSEILEKVRSIYASEFLETRTIIKKVFRDKIQALGQTALRQLHPDSSEYERVLSDYLDKWQLTEGDYLRRLLSYAKRTRGKAIVLFIDNVDQLAPEYQRSIFLLAQQTARRLDATTIVALREESYYSATVQQTFSAYASRRFHIASPSFRAMIGSRLVYAIEEMSKGPDDFTITALRGHVFDRQDIAEFLTIVQSSIFRWSSYLSRFVEAVCFGNMRMALEMFSTFLTSGASDVSKMLLIYRRDGDYHVAFHEFLKSIMLGDRRFYKEEFSRILNLFNVTSERNSSHFTAWRVLAILLKQRGETNTEGLGYVELGRLVGMFETIFDNTRDVMIVLDRLVQSQLIEANTRSTTTVADSSHVRTTSAGWYYIRHLIHKFAYLDLVQQDTPIDDRRLEEELRKSMYRVDNLGDREQDKLERVRTRFDRVQTFLDYLAAQENREREVFGLAELTGPITSEIVPNLMGRFRSEREYINRRLVENRQRYSEDPPDDTIGDDAAFFGVSMDDELQETEE
ncbi:MAG: hypothetical protein V3T84_10950 [Phycisphaerales bacterium]